MSSTNKTPFSAAIQGLNKTFWLASIIVWLLIVGRSQIWLAGFTSKIFWINFLVFLAAGLGTVATTHFAASALPLCIGVMLLADSSHNVKAGWFWLSVYVGAAIVIGFFAGVIKLLVYLNDKPSTPADRDS